MSATYVWDFDRQMAMSQGEADEIPDLLLRVIPDAVSVRPSMQSDDMSGTDWWVLCRNGDELSVDMKVRDLDPVERFGADDLALETWSVRGRKTGWTLDPTKRTDYVLWWWKPTRRHCLLPLPLLRAVFADHRDEWADEFGRYQQRNRGWTSECVFVPRVVVWRAIYERFGGTPNRRAA